MKSPVEHIRVSAKGKEILIKIKRKTGIEYWNAICRIALLKSLSDKNRLTAPYKNNGFAIDMEWKVFAGPFHDEIASIIIYKAYKDNIDLSRKDKLSNFINSHIERGIITLQNISNLQMLI